MYGKKPPFSMKPHFPTLNPTNMPADFPRLNTPSGQNFPSLQQFSIFSLPPKQSSSISSNDMQYITPGKYAVLGFFADSHKTTETDRLMATQIGNYFCCHTCGRRPRADEKFTPDHQPPSCIFTELPHELGYSHQFWEFKYGGWLFQTWASACFAFKASREALFTDICTSVLILSFKRLDCTGLKVTD